MPRRRISRDPVNRTASAPRFVLYARKSTDREDKQVQSIGDQLRLCREHAQRHGLMVLEEITESRSAKRHGVRIGFKSLLKEIESGKADGILCWHPDRLARNAVDGALIIDMLDRSRLKHLIFLSGYAFENTSEGKLMLGLVFGQSKYQVDKLSTDVSRGMASKRLSGGFPHRSPEGYLNFSHPNGRKDIMPDPERFPLLRRAIDEILTGRHTPMETLRLLNSVWGYRTRPHERNDHLGSPLPKNTFYKLLANPFLYGYCNGPDGPYPGTHTPMVTREEFDRLQSVLTRGGSVQSKVHTFPYTGAINCWRCGYRITASIARGHTYYHCTNHTGKCDRKSIREEELERQVIEQVMLFDFPPELENLLREFLAVQISGQDLGEETQRTNTSRSREKAEKERELSNLLQMRLKDLLTDAEYLRERQRINSRLEQITQMEATEETTLASLRKNLDKAIDVAATARERLRSIDPLMKRHVLHLISADGISPTLEPGRLRIALHPHLAPFVKHRSGVMDLKSTLENARFKHTELGFQSQKEPAFSKPVPHGCTPAKLLKHYLSELGEEIGRQVHEVMSALAKDLVAACGLAPDSS